MIKLFNIRKGRRQQINNSGSKLHEVSFDENLELHWILIAATRHVIRVHYLAKLFILENTLYTIQYRLSTI